MRNEKNAQAELQELFDIARSKGLAHTKKEFAELVGIHPANFSSFLSGYTVVTEKMMRKIKNAAIVAGVISGDRNSEPVPQKTKEELRKELDCAYNAASEQAGIESWNKLAEFVGIPYTSIYRVITGRGALTESLLRRIQMELATKGIIVEGSPFANLTNNRNNNAQNETMPVSRTSTDERWFKLVAEKDAQIDRLLGIIEKMQLK